MHEEIDTPSNRSNESSFENIRIGLRMERAIVATRLRIIGGYILEGFAPLAGVPIPPKIKDHDLEYSNTTTED